MFTTGIKITKILKSLGFYVMWMELCESMLSDTIQAAIHQVNIGMNLDLIISIVAACLIAKIIKLVQYKTDFIRERMKLIMYKFKRHL